MIISVEIVTLLVIVCLVGRDPEVVAVIATDSNQSERGSRFLHEVHSKWPLHRRP